MSKRLTSRSGKKLLMAACSSSKISNIVVSFVRMRSCALRLVQVQQLHGPAGLFTLGVADHQSSQTGAVDHVRLLQVQDGVLLSLIRELAEFAAQVRDFGAGNQPAVQIQNDDAFDFARLHLKRHNVLSI